MPPLTARMTQGKLALADLMRELNTGDRDRRALEALEAQHRRTPPLDRAMILLDNVVEVLAASNPHAPPGRMLATQ